MSLIISKNIDELNVKAAAWIVEQIQSTLMRQPRFTIALAGGNTPKKLYQSLASKQFKVFVEWDKVHFFWGDERCVPFNDERSNARMAFDTLIDHVPVLPENVHIIKTDISPTESASRYEKLLHQYFLPGSTTFDLVLLGLGDDAHTLSIFPGSQIVFEKEHWVKSVHREGEIIDRITLTPQIVNDSSRIAFLVSGKNKSVAFKKARSPEYDPLHYPAQSIRPVNGELVWFVDEDVTGSAQ